ncbi:hypothetical protein [Mesorhizobium sp. L-2-11]|uniref:hypothetical protein n=1 Tax=Mesorhizobium sp. L-2-11 TaxID=2744521 RepID=UPI0019283F73|nr:hypothetical protein [Mesorhizobium sp. L-2-11]BCH18264.1 hypothetical protein MesoLjLa_51150 [Mesorhizobium sp. L-2-11]
MGRIVLTYDPHWPMLDIDIEHGNFRGHGVVYFPESEVSEFITSLKAYPLQSAMLSLESPGLIKISVFPADGVGHLTVQIEVAEEIEADDFARVRLRTDYSRLSRFTNQLSLMAKGELTEIILEEDKA